MVGRQGGLGLLGRSSANNPPFSRKRSSLGHHAELANQPMPFYPFAIKPVQSLSLRLHKPARFVNQRRSCQRLCRQHHELGRGCFGNAICQVRCHRAASTNISYGMHVP
ncbi:hypothetical protein V8C37DRAFT_395903 [Trichoderma ceciliae]